MFLIRHPIKTMKILTLFLGFTSITTTSYDIMNGYYKYYIREPLDLLSKYGNNNSNNDNYALITGGSTGLGKELALNLASKGFNLIIIARDSSKLEKTKTEINSLYRNIDIQTIQFDFSKFNYYQFRNVISNLNKLKISLLANNVAAFETKGIKEIQFDELKSLIFTNCITPIFMNRLLISQMKKNENECAIINIGSQYADRKISKIYNPYFSTKAFHNMYYKSIGIERNSNILMKKKGKIDVFNVFPGLMKTEMFTTFNGNKEITFLQGLLLENTDYFWEQTLKLIGYQNENEIYGSERQAFFHYFFKNIMSENLINFN